MDTIQSNVSNNPQVQELESEVQKIIETYENDFSEEKPKKLKPIIDNLAKKIDQTFDSINEKQDKAKLLYLKGKLWDQLPEYSKNAEESLSKSLKLSPLDKNCWNTLGHILWKKKDYEGAQKCFEGAIEQCGKNKESLQNLSIVLRQLGKNEEEKKAMVQKSIDLAKEAIQLDIKDGQSWYILGNAYFCNFFINLKKLSELQTALKAYTQAEQHQSKPNPDLYYNRAQILTYLEDYDKAIEQYIEAGKLDPQFKINDLIQNIRLKVSNINNFIQQKGKMKEQKLTMFVKQIPIAFKSQPQNMQNYNICNLSQLNEGLNKNCVLSCKVSNIITKSEDVPAIFIFVDFKSDFGAFSVYNANQEIYSKIHESSDIYIVDPLIKTITLQNQNQNQAITYKCVQIFEIQNLWVDNEKIINTFSPSIVVNETFQH